MLDLKLSEYKGEEALDVLADLIEPASEVFSDKDFLEEFRNGKKSTAVKIAIKNHKKAIIQILAVLDGEDPETYSVGIFSLPKKLLEIISDPDLLNLFTSAE